MCKDAVNHLEANKIPQAIVRVGKALGPLTDILEQFDHSVGMHVSGSHTCRSKFQSYAHYCGRAEKK